MEYRKDPYMQHSSHLKFIVQKSVAVIVPCLLEFSSALTAHSYNSEITGVLRVSWPTQPSIYSTCSGQISQGPANTWESIRVNAQGCTQQQAPGRANQASDICAGKSNPNWGKRHVTSQEPFLQLRWGRRRESKTMHHWLECSWNEPFCLTEERHWDGREIFQSSLQPVQGSKCKSNINKRSLQQEYVLF